MLLIQINATLLMLMFHWSIHLSMIQHLLFVPVYPVKLLNETKKMCLY